MQGIRGADAVPQGVEGHLSADVANRARRWLMTQCGMISKARGGAVMVQDADSQSLRVVCLWPQDYESIVPTSEFSTALVDREPARLSIADSHTRLLKPLPATEPALPLLVVLDIETGDDKQLKVIDNLLAWGMEWLAYTLQQPPGQNGELLSEVFPLVAICLDQQDFQSLSTTLVTELAQRFDCQRASLGIRKRRQTEVVALSHSARIKQDANLLRSISLAMDEAVDQDRVLNFTGEGGVERGLDYAHGALARETGDGCILTLPFSHHGDALGALTLERPLAVPFDSRSIEILERVLAVLAPVMLLMRQEEMGLLTRCVQSLGRTTRKLLGPTRYGLKLLAVSVVALVLFLAFATGDWRVTADAVVEGRVQRTIAAPIDGFIQSAEARAGDLVAEGELLGTLDDSDLKLERLKWSTLRQQMVSESREAVAQRNRAEVSIIAARIEQADAELRLLDEQLARTRISAPFAGVVIEGDLSQRLGTPVSRGDALFKVAPLEDYRVVLKVDERDIRPISVGQVGALVLASMPDRRLPIRVERITSVSTASDGSNVFRVEASLTEPADGLRPGMEGVGKIELGEARLGWIWSRELLAWLRIKTWTWWR
ncbi:MAG: HlyD family efflux transporter periplasmic adaptor subunit [Halieaceae bacterium]|nr:HlyD family efflux transporter periplasmic adaptor subunit [Halieaceae bacterium]